MEQGITKNAILSQLSRSPHGKLTEYLPVGKRAAAEEPEFLAHLIAWDKVKGQVRDAKVALPIVSLAVPGFPEELAENSLAHLAMLGPRELVRAYRFAIEVRLPGRMRQIRRLVEQYLREKEEDRRGWDRLAVQHRHSLKELYALAHVKPGAKADSILFKGDKPFGSVFDVISRLKDMAPVEAAGEILERRIPFLIALGALGSKAKDPDLVLALIQRMSPTELVTNTKMLEKLGIKTNPALRGAYENALERTAKSGGANLLKTTRAVEAMEDEGLKEKLRGVQEKQIQAFGGVDGNWLVLGDASPSMELCIEASRRVAATLAKMVKGEVHLIYFDSSPRHFNVTGKSYDAILKETQYVRVAGGTSIGCGVQYALGNKYQVDGIAIISDAMENTAPRFVDQYKRLCEDQGKDIPVYLYRFHPGATGYQDTDLAISMQREEFDMQEFDLRTGVDYYSLPNIVQTMRVNRYSLADEVLATPLLTLKDVFKFDVKELAHA